MNTILVPTDFSKNADKALQYGIAIAKKENAKIILVHALDIPLSIQYNSSFLLERKLSVMEEDARIRLKISCIEIEKLKIECEFLNNPGATVDVIMKAAQKKKADLIVMGTKGKGGIPEVLIGSNTSRIIEKARCPVIAVPPSAKFNGLHKITYATDYNTLEIRSVKEVVEIAKKFNAKITMLHVSDRKTDKTSEKKLLDDFMKKLKRQIKFIKIAYKLAFGVNLQSALEKHLKLESPDLLVMTTKHRNLFEKIFSPSITKRMAFHSRIPLMAFHHARK